MPAARAGSRTPGSRWLQTEAGKGWVTISPPLIYALLLLIGPIIVIVANSFWSQDYLTIDRSFTLENYKAALTEPIYRDLLFRSLFVSVTVAFVTVILAYPVAWFVSFRGGRYKGLWLFIITVPFWSGYLLRILSWKVILGYKGVLNETLLYLGVIAEPLSSLIYNVNAAIITLAHSWAAFAILPLFVSLEKLDRSLLEAAADLGDGPVRRFLRITLPLTAPGIIAALMIVMIPTVGDYVTPKLVGGKDGVMIANAIQVQFGKASNWPLGAALAVSTMVIVTMVAGAIVLLIAGLKRLVK
ncbi:ABC transporter permease [Hoeflea olei]|uniref:Spermidine/putrescine ABC transporter n=1 Tax=Hoeflea olei TaxID=1480615 RepID=A0A1C1YW16_9HYPH|nr:ABC transporter permease [Hoeflea olei]OCW57672.1 spermidine/putrescine ABC transporter [Hoeflea olei]